MFLLHRPSAEDIDRFIGRSQDLPLSYGPVGLAQSHAGDFDIDDTAVVIGRGRAVYDRARAALTAWKQFNVGWVELFPRSAPTEPGTVVAVLIRHFGFWSLNGCRVVYRLNAGAGDSRFGFAYGTLTNHAEAGEELFHRIRAASRPRASLARMGYPLVRRLQARFRRDSAEAMKRAAA